MLTVVGLLVYAVIQRQVRLYLRTHDQHVPGNKGETAMPTAAVVLSLFAPVAVVQMQISNAVVRQIYGVHPHHLMICDALGLDRAWYEAPPARVTLRQGVPVDHETRDDLDPGLPQHGTAQVAERCAEESMPSPTGSYMAQLRRCASQKARHCTTGAG